jgi:hypothetical protein
MRRLVSVVGLFSAVACAPAPIPQAPDAIDANVKWFWTNAGSATDATLLAAALKLSVAGKADTRSTPFKGQHRERLSKDDLIPVGLETNDPSKARGLLVVNLFDCTQSKLESILTDPDQATLYPGVYERNVRTLHEERQPFLDHTQSALSWSSDISITFPVADPYSSKIEGSLRRVKPDGSADGFPAELLVERVFLTEPATFGATSTSFFRQDYQIEIFWEQSPGRIFHAYGMWREVKVGGFDKTLEDDDFFTLMLNNLVDWDGKTAALCAK